MKSEQNATSAHAGSRSERSLEQYFSEFRKNIIGVDLRHQFAYGEKQVTYADWVASGRLYAPIEEFMMNTVGPYVGNTHTESSLQGTTMTHLYAQARQALKEHVNAGPDDVLISTGSGMTAAINKFQRILNLRVPENYVPVLLRNSQERPLVLITHMEHHSNQVSWLSCYCDVEIINRNDRGLPDLNHMETLLQANRHRQVKIGSFSAASNVTGIQTPIHQMAALMHKYGGYCFADYAASAPYVKIDMHPAKPEEKLDAIFFSPHKFLGGPGSTGILIFDKALYRNAIPDHPGGGTVAWTNPWHEHRFLDDIEAREDGGTPAFLQTMRAALAIRLKEQMGLEKMQQREAELNSLFINAIGKNSKIQILEPLQERLGIFSFFVSDMHYNLIVRLLNDRYGIQVRGGCSCAGTYGHILLNVSKEMSQLITCKIDQGDLSEKPGWVRVSLHPTMPDQEAIFIAQSINEIISNYHTWAKDYEFDTRTAEFKHKSFRDSFPVNLQDCRLI